MHGTVSHLRPFPLVTHFAGSCGSSSDTSQARRGEYRPLFEPNNPVAVLRIKLNPRRKRTDLTAKRKELEGAIIYYSEIEPKRGLVRTENLAVAKFYSECTQPASRLVAFQRGQQETKVLSNIYSLLAPNYQPIPGCANSCDIRIFNHHKTPSFPREGIAKTFFRDGHQSIPGPAESTNFHFFEKLEASAEALAPDVSPNADSTDPVAVDKGTSIICTIVLIHFEGMSSFLTTLRWMENSQ